MKKWYIKIRDERDNRELEVEVVGNKEEKTKDLIEEIDDSYEIIEIKLLEEEE